MKPVRQREMVDYVRTAWEVSIRRACRALLVERSGYHYRSRRARQAPLSKRIKEIAETRVRYGYGRIHVLLRREGWMVNHKWVCRLYREQGLQLRNKTPKRGSRPSSDPTVRRQGCERHLGDGLRARAAFRRHKIRALTVVDVLSRVSPAIGVRPSYRGHHVVETLERGAVEFGYPKTIRVDNGPEFDSRELDLWAYLKGVTLNFSRPG